MITKEQVLLTLTTLPPQFSIEELIRALQPFEDAWQNEWRTLAAQFRPGTKVTGQVAHKAPFGDFVDIGTSEPALLEIPDIPTLTPELFQLGLHNPLGSTITAWVLGLYNERKKQLRLTQDPTTDFNSLPGFSS